MSNNKKKQPLAPGETILLIANFIWMLALYYACIYFGERTGLVWPYQLCTGAYAAAVIILPAVSAYLSGKIVSKNGSEERTDEQKKLSRTLILWVMPLIAVLLIDILDLFVVEYFKKILFV
ncbi:MAG: hypothetical protein IKL24_01925 [Clostridia bacterium]|nr:hypothetical protein [Clostridia bacterium]